MKQIFDEYIENSFGEMKQAEPKFKQFEYNYKSYFPQDKNAPVLDIGVGRGEMLACMKKWGYNSYLGLDISPSTIKFCQSINLKCELTDDTISWLYNHKSSFQTITLLDVLEHIKKEDMVNFLLALKEALKEDGVLIIQTPNLQAPDAQLHRYNDITHEFGFTENSLKQVLIAAGFKNFYFSGFEVLVKNNLLYRTAKLFRLLYWFYVKVIRMLNTNLHPELMNPVFFAIVKK